MLEGDDGAGRGIPSANLSYPLEWWDWGAGVGMHPHGRRSMDELEMAMMDLARTKKPSGTSLGTWGFVRTDLVAIFRWPKGLLDGEQARGGRGEVPAPLKERKDLSQKRRGGQFIS